MIPGVDEGRILVIVQLGGGNDGLNTVVPVGHDDYYRVRPTIGIAKQNTLDLGKGRDVALHPALEGIKSLYDNFPGFKQNETRIAVYGNSTSRAVEERGLVINIKAPEPETPSMTMALEKYLQVSNKPK